jgi:hypothetical protein
MRPGAGATARTAHAHAASAATMGIHRGIDRGIDRFGDIIIAFPSTVPAQ